MLCILMPFARATSEWASSWTSTPRKSPSATTVPRIQGMKPDVIMPVSIGTLKISLSMSVVDPIWLPIMYANSGMTSRNV